MSFNKTDGIIDGFADTNGACFTNEQKVYAWKLIFCSTKGHFVGIYDFTKVLQKGITEIRNEA